MKLTKKDWTLIAINAGIAAALIWASNNDDGFFEETLG